MNLTSLKTIRQLLERHGLRADKRFGQNFLVDANYLARIVQASGAGPGRTVYEVGPGLGVLTRALALTGARVITLEMDQRLKGVLAETLDGLDVQIIWGDALRFDWQQVPLGSLFAGNLPYNVATALLTQMLKAGRFSQMVALVQKEVALRMVALPNTPQYGVLSLRMQHHAHVKRLFDLPPGVFVLPPKVTSSLVLLTPHPTPDHPALFALIEAAFGQRRKTLRNSLAHHGYAVGDLDVLLHNMGLAANVRAEGLSLEQFTRLAQHLVLSKQPTP